VSTAGEVTIVFSIQVVRRSSTALATVLWNRSVVIYRHRHFTTFVSISTFALCINFHRNISLILYHVFELIILLLDQVHQICQDFIRLRRRRNRKKRWRKRNFLYVQRRWKKECYVHRCEMTSVGCSFASYILNKIL